MNDPAVFPVANLTTITAPCTKEDPTVVMVVFRSTVKLTPPGGGGGGPGFGVDGEVLLLLQEPIQTAQTTATGPVRVPKNCLLSITFKLRVN